MDWLKKILEGAKIEEGKLDIESLMKDINIEFPKNAVPKETFNDINGQLKTANTTIADLKKNNASNETLQKTIKEHEATIGTLKIEAENNKKSYVLKDKLKELGVTDTDYLIYKQGGIDKFIWDKEGNIVGLEDTIKPYKETSPHLFNQEQKQPQFSGIKPVDNSIGAPTKDVNKMSYVEMCEYLEQNPSIQI